MRTAMSLTVSRKLPLLFNIDKKSDTSCATRDIFPTRASKFSLYQASTLVTADFISAPIVFIFAATGPMNDDSFITASRAFS